MAPTQLRPFHEIIIEAVENALNTGEMLRLMKLIMITHIPKGHDAIIAAIDKFFDFPGATKYARDIRVVKERLQAEKDALNHRTPVSLDDLQLETEKFLALLKERNPVLMSWHEYMQHRLQRMHDLISQILNK